MHKFNPLDNKYILAAWLWIRCVIYIETLSSGQSPNLRAICSLWNAQIKKNKVKVGYLCPFTVQEVLASDLTQVIFRYLLTIKVDLINYDVGLQYMLVSRTNIRGLYWAICSLQSKAVVQNQLKSSSSLTFSRAQFPTPLNHEIILVSLNGALTRDPSSKGSWAVFLIRLCIWGHSTTTSLTLQDIKHLPHNLEKSLPTHLEVINSLLLS